MVHDATSSRTGTIKFIALVLTVAGVLACLHLAAAALTIGRPTAKSANMCRNVSDRMALGKDMASPKLVLVGGSGVRAGLSAELMAKELDKNVLNFGLQAALGPGLILGKTRQIVKEGDSVILLLEYPQLSTDRWNPISVDLAMACGQEVLFGSGAASILEALFAAGPRRLMTVFAGTAQAKASTQAHVNPYGDRNLESFPALSQRDAARVDLYQPVPIGVDAASRGARAIAEFASWAKRRKINVYASWPNTIDHPVYQRSAGFEEIKRFYEGVGITFIDTPNKGLYPRAMFYDTQYHLTYEAIRMRTRAFVTAVKAAGVGSGETVAGAE
mgnify:CR=1 FL=1